MGYIQYYIYIYIYTHALESEQNKKAVKVLNWTLLTLQYNNVL